MAAITENYNVPTLANPVSTDLDKMRERMNWLLCARVANSLTWYKTSRASTTTYMRFCPVIPGWAGTAYSNSSPQDYSKPDYWLLTSNNDTREIRIDLTWSTVSSSQIKITQMVVSFNDGTASPGMTTVDDGTITITFDGFNNITGFTSA